MKKTVSILVVMAVMLSVFFCTPVFAANPTAANYKNAAYSINGVNFKAAAAELYPTTTTSLIGGVKVGVLVSVQVENTTDQDAKILKFGIQLTTGYNAYIVDYENFTNDLYVTVRNDVSPYIAVAPSADYSYDNDIIVPAHQSLWMIAVVYFKGDFNTSNQSYSGINLQGVTITNSNVTFGSYPHGGSAADLSAIEDYLDSIDQNVSDTEDILEDIRQLVTWSGTLPSYGDIAFSSTSVPFTYLDGNFSGRIYRKVLGSYALSESTDFELPDVVYTNGVKKTIVEFNVNTTVTDSAANYDTLRIDFVNVTGISAFEIVSIDDDLLSPAISINEGKYCLYLNNPSTNNYDVGKYYLQIVIALYTELDVNPSFPALTFQFSAVRSVGDTLSNQSNDLADQSSQVHSQEAAYYQQNSAAIQATGLSNYQFDASAVSGLTGVRGDFLDVWNSLGSWNSVYIFSLTLGLALTILRHSPSAISSALRKRNNNGGK